MLTVASSLLGLWPDDKKSVSQAAIYTVLGARAVVDFALLKVTVAVDPKKAVKWALHILECLEQGVLDSETAQKVVGRSTAAVTMSGTKIGRAHAKPLFAQSYAPMHGGRLSHLLRAALFWWVQFFCLAATHGVPGERAAAARPDLDGRCRGIPVGCCVPVLGGRGALVLDAAAGPYGDLGTAPNPGGPSNRVPRDHRPDAGVGDLAAVAGFL